MRRVLVFVFAALFLSACGGSGGSLDDVKVSDGNTPKITAEKDYSVDKTQVRVVDEGDGPEVKSGDTVTVHYIAVNGRTAKEFDNSFTNKQPMTLKIDTSSLPGFVKAIEGQKVGSKVLAGIAPEDGTGALGNVESLGLETDDTMLFYFDITSIVPTMAEGKTKDLPKDVPSLKTDKDGKPTGFEKTKKTAKKFDKSAAYVVIEGDGQEVKKDDAVTVHYLGQKYPDGDVFDQSWQRDTTFQTTIGAGRVIKCWDEQLVGQKVGSRVVLTCTADDAYGDKDNGQGQPTGPLLFVVDVLAAA